MYYSVEFFMFSSSVELSSLSRSKLSQHSNDNQGLVWDFGSVSPFLVVLSLITFAMICAPERPDYQASICQKHNPVVACEVW